MCRWYLVYSTEFIYCFLSIFHFCFPQCFSFSVNNLKSGGSNLNDKKDSSWPGNKCHTFLNLLHFNVLFIDNPFMTSKWAVEQSDNLRVLTPSDLIEIFFIYKLINTTINLRSERKVHCQ